MSLLSLVNTTIILMIILSGLMLGTGINMDEQTNTELNISSENVSEYTRATTMIINESHKAANSFEKSLQEDSTMGDSIKLFVVIIVFQIGMGIALISAKYVILTGFTNMVLLQFISYAILTWFLFFVFWKPIIAIAYLIYKKAKTKFIE